MMPDAQAPMPPIGNQTQDMGTPDMGEPMPDEPMPDDPMNDGEEGSEGGVAGDVRKYSGELSQALNDYNEQEPDDEEKLNKYAINMIAAQVKGKLDGKDVKKIVNKLEGGNDSDGEMPDEDDDEGMPPSPDKFQNESRRMTEEVVTEIMDELLNGRKPVRRDNLIRRKDISRNNPFVSKR